MKGWSLKDWVSLASGLIAIAGFVSTFFVLSYRVQQLEDSMKERDAEDAALRKDVAELVIVTRLLVDRAERARPPGPADPPTPNPAPKEPPVEPAPPDDEQLSREVRELIERMRKLDEEPKR